jgi:hypothetical protein
LLIAVVGGLLALRRRDWPMAMFTALFIHQSLFAARHLPLAALLLLPLALSQLSFPAQVQIYAERLRQIDRRILGIVPAAAGIAVGAFVLALIPAIKRGFDPQEFPVRAASYFEGRESTSRIFASDQWGGYVIWRFGGRLKVYLDGRSDFYGKDVLERYGTVNDVRPGWDRILDAERITHVMVGPEKALAQALRLHSGWRAVRADAIAVVFERTGL